MNREEAPDPEAARHRYDDMAGGYDRQVGQQAGRFGRYEEGVRKRAVAAVALRAGQTVIDAGCGTGASFARLVAAVGPRGLVVGVDQSSGMLAVAARRISAAGWPNVDLVESPVEDAMLPVADAAFFFLTHDLMRTPAALDNVTDAVRPGGRVVAAGAQRPSLWLGPIALAAGLVMRRYVTTRDGLARPWDLLAARLEDVTADSILLGAMYVMAGRRPPAGGLKSPAGI
jgi:ubiquinone/menaquinone biosynthesis C-methylase UbiE